MDNPEDAKWKAASEVVDKCLQMLGEHFDAVQILASATQDDNATTDRVYKGRGNFFARLGMSQDFIEADKSADAAKQIARVLNE